MNKLAAIYNVWADSVEHLKKSRDFKDCEGRTIAVEQLKLPLDVRPIVENLKTLLIDLRAG